MIDFQQSGLNDIIDKLQNTDVDDIVKDTMEEARMICEEYALSLCPVDTGELKNSIYSFTTPNGFVIGASARHAVFNEYGSITTPIGSVHSPLPAKKTGFRPFMRVALNRTRNDMQSIFGGKFQENLNR